MVIFIEAIDKYWSFKLDTYMNITRITAFMDKYWSIIYECRGENSYFVFKYMSK